MEDDEDGDPVEGVESKGNHNEQEQEEIGAKKGAITWVRIGKYPIWPCLLWPEQNFYFTPVGCGIYRLPAGN